MLKGARCESARCAINRRDYPPGQQSYRRGRFSAYRQQLREKQKLKRYYGVWERQFRRYFAQAERRKGNTGENLLCLLEQRLDNVVYRLGMAGSRAQARQFITHRHVEVNGQTVNVPSRPVRPGDIIAPRQHGSSAQLITGAREESKGRPVPSWLEVTEEPIQGRVVNVPNRDEVPIPIQEELVVELCSR